MLNWKSYFTNDIQAWLLENDNPSVRYFTLTNLFNKPKNSKAVQTAKKLIMERDPVKKILSHQNPDGSFLTKAIKKVCTQLEPKSGYQPKYKGTIWQAIFLAQLGADQNDERIKNLCEYIMCTNYMPELKVIGLHWKDGDIRRSALPCYVSNMVWALSKLGFYKDPRIQNTIKWIIKYQRFDDGDFKTPDEWPYRGKKDRCFGKHSCHVGCTQAMKAMTVIPEKDMTTQITKFIQKGIDYLLLHKVYKRSRREGKFIKKEYEFLAFPQFYYDDVLGILETLLFFKVKDRAIDDAIEFVLEKRADSGHWLLEKTIRPGAMFARIEHKGIESRWVTYRALKVLKMYSEVYN